MAESNIISSNSGRAKWRFFAGLLMIALGTEIYFLIHDIPILNPFHSPDLRSPQSPSIGQLMLRQNSVRVQSEGDVVWDETTEKQILHPHEALLTLEHSKAEVAFLDGSDLVIDENSLVQLERTDEAKAGGHLTIKLLRGAIRRRSLAKGVFVKPGQNPPMQLEIQVGNLRTQISHDAELTVVAVPESNRLNGVSQADQIMPQIIIEKGSAEIQSPHESLHLSQGQSVETSKNLKLESHVTPPDTIAKMKTQFEVKPEVQRETKIDANPEQSASVGAKIRSYFLTLPIRRLVRHPAAVSEPVSAELAEPTPVVTPMPTPSHKPAPPPPTLIFTPEVKVRTQKND